MNRTQIKKMLKAAGFNGRVVFRKHGEFGTPDSNGPAIHYRWIQCNVHEIADHAHCDNFKTVVIYMEPASYYRYRELISNPKHVWTEGEINGLRKCLGYCTNWSSVARSEFTEDIQRMTFPAFKITPEQTRFGLEWLKRTQFKKNGELRASAFIGSREASILRRFKRFEFVGLDFMPPNPYTGIPEAVAPLYRAVARNGDSFTYRVCPMHTGFGANYEVIS